MACAVRKDVWVVYPFAVAPRSTRGRGLELKPGSVKQAREEAGLSLAQVAGKDLSRTAVHLIETGQSRPSLQTLEVIARRTNKPLEFFLAETATEQVAVPEWLVAIERMVALGQDDAAVERAEQMLSQPLTDDDRARLRFLMATAMVRRGRYREAEQVIEPARGHFERAGRRLMQAECMGVTSTILLALSRPGARAEAEAGIELCSKIEPVPTDVVIRLYHRLAAAHMQAEQWEEAVACYQKARELSVLMSDYEHASDLFEQLAEFAARSGEVIIEARYQRRAVVLKEWHRERLAAVAGQTNSALALIRLGRLKEAEGPVQAALESAGASPQARAHALLMLADLRLHQEQMEEALMAAQEASILATTAGDRVLLAEVKVMLGRLSEARGETRETDSNFWQAMSLYRELGVREQLTEAQAEYADILQKRGDLEGAHRLLKDALGKLQVADDRMVAGLDER